MGYAQFSVTDDDDIPFDDDEPELPTAPAHTDCKGKRYELGHQVRNVHDLATAVVTNVSDPLGIWILYDDLDTNESARFDGRHGEILDAPKRANLPTPAASSVGRQQKPDAVTPGQFEDVVPPSGSSAASSDVPPSAPAHGDEERDDLRAAQAELDAMEQQAPLEEASTEDLQPTTDDDVPFEDNAWPIPDISEDELPSPAQLAYEIAIAPPPGDPKPWRIYHGDGPSGLLSLPEVDVLISDVPFSKKVDDGNEADNTRDNTFRFDPMTEELRERMAQAIGARVRRWAIIMTSDDEVELWKAAMARAGMIFYRTGHWIRLGTKPQMNGMGPAQGAEYLLIFHSRFGAQRWNGGGKAAIWYAHIVQGDERRHETQKPTTLLKALIEDFTDPGELVADICAGSFQLGIVAVSMGRRFVGWDIREQDVNMARELFKVPLLDNEPMQASLFAEPRAATRTKQARALLDHEVQRAVQSQPGIKLAELLVQLGNPEDHEVRGSLKRLSKRQLVRREGKTSDSKYFPLTLADREAIDAEHRAKLAASIAQTVSPPQQEAPP